MTADKLGPTDLICGHAEPANEGVVRVRVDHLESCMTAWQADKERIAELELALIRLRDCDWVISLPDRMDAVREIARGALGK